MQRWNRAGLFRNSKESPSGRVSSRQRGMDEMRPGGGQEPDDTGPGGHGKQESLILSRAGSVWRVLSRE